MFGIGQQLGMTDHHHACIVFFCDWFSSPMPLPISPPIPSPWIPEPTLVLVPFAPRRCSLFLDPKPRGTLPMVDGHLQLVRGKSSSHRRNSFRSSSLRSSPPRSSSSISNSPRSSSPNSGPPRSSSHRRCPCRSSSPRNSPLKNNPCGN